MIKNKNFLQFRDLTREEIGKIFERTTTLKKDFKKRNMTKSLDNRTLVLIFEKQSTRTRLAFEAGMQHLGGNTIFLNSSDSQLGRGEPVEDSARVISRMCDLIMIRTHEHSFLEKFAKHSEVPVINGLTNDHHPCQLLADLYTFIEKRGSLENKRVAWIGDSNNVLASWVQAAELVGFELSISSPPGFEGVDYKSGHYSDFAKVRRFSDPSEAAVGADLVLTDVWTSMGFENEAKQRHELFQKWQVNEKLMELAHPNALFMHCLPAHRGEEVTSGVIDGPSSVVWDEAENRLHTQKALLEIMIS